MVPNLEGADEEDHGDVSVAPYEAMKDIRLAGAFLPNGGDAMPMNSNSNSWNVNFVATTGNVIADLLHNFIWNAVHGCTSCLSMRR